MQQEENAAAESGRIGLDDCERGGDSDRRIERISPRSECAAGGTRKRMCRSDRGRLLRADRRDMSPMNNTHSTNAAWRHVACGVSFTV